MSKMSLNRINEIYEQKYFSNDTWKVFSGTDGKIKTAYNRKMSSSPV